MPQIVVALVVALAGFTTAAGATPKRMFADPVTIGLDSWVGAARSADLNGDGRMDLVTAGGAGIVVWTGDEHALLVSRPEAGISADLWRFDLADLDGDGAADIVTTSPIESLGVCWMRGRGDATFEAPRSLSPGAGWRHSVVADFDADGRADVAAVGQAGLFLFRDAGNGWFVEAAHDSLVTDAVSLGAVTMPGAGGAVLTVSSPGGWNGEEYFASLTSYAFRSGAWALLSRLAGDYPVHFQSYGRLNDDDVPDWCGLCEWGPARIAFGDRDSLFREPLAVGCRSVSGGTGAIGDLDGDGLDDILLPTRSDWWRLPRIEVLYSRADGSRENLIRLTTPGRNVDLIHVADFDGDGRRDIAAFVNKGWGDAQTELQVIRNRGGRRFDAITHWPGSENAIGLFAAQLDASTARELVLLSESHFGICDLRQDGMLESPRYLHPAPTGLDRWHATPVFFRDLNADGFDDLLMANGTNFTVALATGDGRLAEARHEPWPGFVAVGDLDGRFGPDAVFLGTDGAVSVAFRSSSGVYSPPVRTGETVPPMPWGSPLLECADLDRDGRDELLIGRGMRAECGGEESLTDTLSMLRWTGVSFTTIQRTLLFDCNPEDWGGWYDGPQEFRDVVVLDIDGMGWLDIAVLTGGEYGRLTPLTDGGEGFYTPSLHGGVGSEYPRSLTAGDFDGDGWKEIVVPRNQEGSIGRVTIQSFRGTVQASAVLDDAISENGIATAVAGDFDGDGDDDLATLHWTGAWQDWWDESSALTVRWSLASQNAAVTQVIDSGAREGRTAVPTDQVHLTAAWPNPARDAVQVRFATLPSGEARLELLDVTGRRVQEQRLAATAGGEGVASFALGRDVAPGVYWLRLEQGGRAATTRIAVVR